MNKDLRVLMIEDSPADAELIVHKLYETGCQVAYELVDTAHDIRKSLGEKRWDVILCDYFMPNINPYMVLDILRETDLDIPLIVISGKIGEKEAVKLLKAGCNDCVMKSDLRRLPDVINRETKEANVREETRIILEKKMLFQNEEKEKLATKLLIANREILNQIEKQKELEFMSYHDLLTGLYNRRFYEEELKRLDTNRNLPITLVMGDVNGLKFINDTFGHAIGDEFLKKAAEIIKKGCRTDDIIARLGGDEFVILLPTTSAIDAERIIERIKDMYLAEKVYGIDISVSFGYQTKTNDEEEMAEIFKIAEDHMYSNKRSVNI